MAVALPELFKRKRSKALPVSPLNWTIVRIRAFDGALLANSNKSAEIFGFDLRRAWALLECVKKYWLDKRKVTSNKKEIHLTVGLP